jgi:hypothetical protein
MFINESKRGFGQVYTACDRRHAVVEYTKHSAVITNQVARFNRFCGSNEMLKYPLLSALRLLIAISFYFSPFVVQAQDRPAVADPFGVELGSPGSCSQTQIRLGNPPSRSLGAEIIEFKAINPKEYFPGATSIAVMCRSGATLSVSISGPVLLGNVPQLKTLDQILSDKYGRKFGQVADAPGETSVSYGAVNALLTLTDRSEKFYWIHYQYIKGQNMPRSSLPESQQELGKQRQAL